MTFVENEWVLCYEPDPTKVRVIYSAKIVAITGSSTDPEYLVHFRGWNPSWDRRVSEDYLLKDIPSNRVLQSSLSAAIVKKGGKKSPAKKRVLYSMGLHLNNNPPKKRIKKDESVLKIPEACRAILEKDGSRVRQEGLLPRLPSVCPVSVVLERFVHHFALYKIAGVEKLMSKKSGLPVSKKESILFDESESVLRSIDICKEIVEGLRIILDFNLTRILLYEKEKTGLESLSHVRPFTPALPLVSECRRPSADRCTNSSSGRSTPTNSGSVHSSNSYISRSVNESLEGWRLLPESLYCNVPSPPSLLYGPIYLLRLFVKLPEILNMMNLPTQKLKLLQKYSNSLLDFLASHPEYFSEDMYSRAPKV